MRWMLAALGGLVGSAARIGPLQLGLLITKATATRRFHVTIVADTHAARSRVLLRQDFGAPSTARRQGQIWKSLRTSDTNVAKLRGLEEGPACRADIQALTAPRTFRAN